MSLPMIVVATLTCQFFPEVTACSRPIHDEGAKGVGVVKDVVEKINGLRIFPDDHKFLCRVEPRCRVARGTYRPGYYGGIW